MLVLRSRVPFTFFARPTGFALNAMFRRLRARSEVAGVGARLRECTDPPSLLAAVEPAAAAWRADDAPRPQAAALGPELQCAGGGTETHTEGSV